MNTTAVHILRKFFILIIMAAGLFNPIAKAQEVQLWLDAYAIKSFGKTKAFEYEGNIGYDKLLQPQGWSDVYFNNTITWESKKSWYLLEGSFEMHFTYDPQGPEIIELRPWVAQKVIFTPYIKNCDCKNHTFIGDLSNDF